MESNQANLKVITVSECRYAGSHGTIDRITGKIGDQFVHITIKGGCNIVSEGDVVSLGKEYRNWTIQKGDLLVGRTIWQDRYTQCLPEWAPMEMWLKKGGKDPSAKQPLHILAKPATITNPIVIPSPIKKPAPVTPVIPPDELIHKMEIDVDAKNFRYDRRIYRLAHMVNGKKVGTALLTGSLKSIARKEMNQGGFTGEGIVLHVYIEGNEGKGNWGWAPCKGDPIAEAIVRLRMSKTAHLCQSTAVAA